MIHPEKSFARSTKIWLAQQSLSFKHRSMENMHRQQKKKSFKLKLENFCRIKYKIFLTQVKLKKFR